MNKEKLRLDFFYYNAIGDWKKAKKILKLLIRSDHFIQFHDQGV